MSVSGLADFGVCTANSVNVRTEPKKGAKSLGKINKDDAVEVLSTSGDWYYVESDVGEGYVPAAYISILSQTTNQTQATVQTAQVTAPKSATKTITVKASCSNKNHVGNSWTQYFTVDGVEIKGSKKVTLTAGQEIVLYSEVVENDKYPDVGYGRTVHKVTEDDLKKGFTVKQEVDVTEDRGRYAGYTATWTVTWTVK